ncbi:unnamed protein product [Gongylonema pulchrum]|uniref:Uncharacterized protein n=1 Tax=Gongylonema pulchrum TaxID=637853 RepID=A0A183DMP4_9BILA|nr:unnamed protein product [Gongylonema pulchrum]
MPMLCIKHHSSKTFPFHGRDVFLCQPENAIDQKVATSSQKCDKILVLLLQWNGMLRRFRTAMPLKRHRCQLGWFDDSFTGREAVDFLINELQKLIQDRNEMTRLVLLIYEIFRC